MDTRTVDLRSLVRGVLASSPSADPVDLARDVLARIDPQDTREALRQALTTIVRQEISLGRMRHTGSDTHRGTAHPGQGPGRPTRTSADRVREAWRAHLEDRLAVGEGAWKRLRDCTVEDLGFAARYREELAAANAYAAERLRKIQKAVEAAGVETVGDLDEDVQRELLDGE